MPRQISRKARPIDASRADAQADAHIFFESQTDGYPSAEKSRISAGTQIGERQNHHKLPNLQAINQEINMKDPPTPTQCQRPLVASTSSGTDSGPNRKEEAARAPVVSEESSHHIRKHHSTHHRHSICSFDRNSNRSSREEGNRATPSSSSSSAEDTEQATSKKSSETNEKVVQPLVEELVPSTQAQAQGRRGCPSTSNNVLSKIANKSQTTLTLGSQSSAKNSSSENSKVLKKDGPSSTRRAAKNVQCAMKYPLSLQSFGEYSSGESAQNSSDGGYAGSASSNEVDDQSSRSYCSSLSNSENGDLGRKKHMSEHKHKPNLNRRNKDNSLSSSDLADFSSGDSGSNFSFMNSRPFAPCSPISDESEDSVHRTRSMNGMEAKGNGKKSPSKISRMSHLSSTRKRNRTGSKIDLSEAGKKCNLKNDKSYMTSAEESNDYGLSHAHVRNAPLENHSKKYIRRHSGKRSQHESLTTPYSFKPSVVNSNKEINQRGSGTSIFDISCDSMAHVMSFLDPKMAHTLLTQPISHLWRTTFTLPQDLWKILCTSEPFCARIDSKIEVLYSSDDSVSSFPLCSTLETEHAIGQFRLLYTSFIRCIKYLDRVKESARNGLSPSSINFEAEHDRVKFFQSNSNLVAYLAEAKAILRNEPDGRNTNTETEQARAESGQSDSAVNGDHPDPVPVDEPNVAKSAKRRKQEERLSSRLKFGRSKITSRVLGPSKNQTKPGSTNLPWSCAIFSIVNWMVAFSDVIGIQIMCLKVAPYLLECERQRITAQGSGFIDIILNAMVLFPDSVELHTAAFHTIVLLARPLGGKEGMLFPRELAEGQGFFNIITRGGKNGIAVMLDSLRRFASNEALQAMGCWSMVNIALNPLHKKILVKLGGISVATNAMIMHPYNPEVQFRALFALINMVVISPDDESPAAAAVGETLGDVNDVSEREIMDEHVEKITNLVVVAMKNFCSSEAILNRACLVLNNLSLHEPYHLTMLWTPNCYQMLEWAMGNYRTDRVLLQSAGGTLQRLQMTLSSDEELRNKFVASLQRQRQSLLEQAQRESVSMQVQEP